MKRNEGLEFHVAKDGDDAWSGELPSANPGGTDGPFSSLERARDAIRTLRPLPEGGVTVYVHEGTYCLAQTFSLTERDSGTNTAPILYRACQDEEVRFIGGRILSGFETVRDTKVLQRLTSNAHGKVVQFDLKGRGIGDLGRFSSRGFGRSISPAHMELFFQGRRMEVARWPDNDFVNITAPFEELPEGDGHGGNLGRIEAGFIYQGDRPRRWKSLSDVWIHGYWAWDWADTYERVDSIDPITGHIRTLPPHGVYGIKAGQRFYFLNIMEELDRPGEYYVNRDDGMLYFWPPAELEEGEAAVSLLEEPLVLMRDVSHVTLRGLTMEYARGNAVEIYGGNDVRLAGCTIRNVGNYAVVVEGGRSHQIIGCNIYHTGDGGIHLSGGDRKTLIPCEHVVGNTHIHHIGEWSRCYSPAIMMSGVGICAAHNLIHDGPHNAILFSGNEHIIEFNHIHHVCQETGDVGAVYIGRDWTQRGNVIKYNFFHHTQGYGMGSMSVYLDDCASGMTIFGNVFYKCTRAAFIGGGRDNRVENNIFVDCDPAVMIDGRGLDESEIWHNMVYLTMKESLNAMNHHQPPYSVRYPELAKFDRYYRAVKGIPPEGNAVVRNISRGGKWLQIHWHAEPEMVNISDNLVNQDPHFVDEAGMDFRLRDDSPAYQIGFERIPIEKIGLYVDEYRSKLSEGM